MSLRYLFRLTFRTALTECESAYSCSAHGVSQRNLLQGTLSARRGYITKIFLRHDIMRHVLTKFLDSKGVEEEVIAKVVATKHYYAFHKTQFAEFERVVTWLSTINLHSGDDLSCVLDQFPNFLWQDINLLESRMRWFIQELRFERHDVGPLLAQNPNLLFHHAEILSNFVQLLESLNITTIQIQELVASDARLLEYCENYEELQSLIRWWKATFELTPHQCGQMILHEPGLLNPAYHEDLPPLYEYLYRLGIGTRHIGQIFANCPQCMIRRLSEIKTTLHKVKKAFSLQQRPLANLLSRFPVLLSINAARAESLAVVLRDELQMTDDQISCFVRRTPSFLLLDLESELRPRVKFLTETVSVKSMEIAQQPDCLMRPLELMMARFKFTEQRGRSQNRPTIDDLLHKSEDIFVKSVNQSVAKYQQFMSWWRVPPEWKHHLRE